MGSSRFPVEVTAICMLSVCWSDQTQGLIYRTFDEFRTLHKGLKRKFPIESGLLKKAHRTLPRFRGKREGWAFRGFYIIVLPSEMGERKKEAPRAPIPTITQPVISQMYQCVAPFRTQDTQNKPFEATKAEKLEVLMKDRTGWWLVENNRKQIAWFPAPYLEDSKEMPIMEENDEEGMFYYVTKAYRAKEPDELSLEFGIVVEVLEKSDSGWWLVWYNGTTGIVPSLFLQPYRNPLSKFLALASPSLGSSLPNLTEAPSLSSKSCTAQPKRNQVYLSQKMQSKDTGSLEGQGIRSPSRSSTSGNSSPASGKERWSSSSGNGSGPSDPEGHLVLTETLLQTSGTPGSASLSQQQQNHPGFEGESSGEPVHLLPSSGVGSLPGGPIVPPRPSPCEILQKCSSLTRRALQRSLEQPSWFPAVEKKVSAN
uniref:NADPH oxidase organizer 1 n=1 Tax=Pseudonaja textilis TaxID=8673 RepID=A0A670XRA0_PSETE